MVVIFVTALRRKLRCNLPAPSLYSIPKAAFALMPLPLVVQYRDKARKLKICPSQRIYVPAFRPCLNKVPFQLVQLFANHKTTPVLGSVSFHAACLLLALRSV